MKQKSVKLAVRYLENIDDESRLINDFGITYFFFFSLKVRLSLVISDMRNGRDSEESFLQS